MPTRKNISKRAIVSIDFSGTASGNPVANSMKVSMCLWPSVEGGDSGHTKSIAILDKGSEISGIITNGTS